jgi:hypothetical protein
VRKEGRLSFDPGASCKDVDMASRKLVKQIGRSSYEGLLRDVTPREVDAVLKIVSECRGDATNGVSDQQLAAEGFEVAAQLLYRTGIHGHWDLPGNRYLKILAGVCGVLGREADYAPVRGRLLGWFWRSVFSVDGRKRWWSPEEIAGLVAYVRTGRNPPLPARFESPERLAGREELSRSQRCAVYVLMLNAGFRDFVTGDPFDPRSWDHEYEDVHHIFPRKWCRAEELDEIRVESLVNRTWLTAATNRSLAGRAPSAYLQAIESDTGMRPRDLDKLIATHRIDPALLRADDFDGFFVARQQALVALIESSMRE